MRSRFGLRAPAVPVTMDAGPLPAASLRIPGHTGRTVLSDCVACREPEILDTYLFLG